MIVEMMKYFSIRLAFAMLFFAIGLAPAQAEVKLPNGEYRETATDLRVKVLGGYVAVERTWIAEQLNKGKYRWYINPAWADLSFEYDDLDGSVKSVRRADSKFERAGNDVFVFERIYFIAKKDGGWRWYDREGNWIRYDDRGRILAYGDRNDVTVHFTRSPNGPIDAVTDHHGNPVLGFGYTGGKLTSVTDRANRKVTYRYEDDRIVEVVDVGNNRWTYGYANGLMISRTDPEQHTIGIDYRGNRVVKVTDELRYATTYEYAYDRGKREHTIVVKTPEGRRIERRYAFDGLLLRQLEGTREVYTLKRAGEFTHIHADERGLATRVDLDASLNPVKITYADGTTFTTQYDPKFSLPLEIVDERGSKTLGEYDAKGNLEKLTEATGTSAERVTTYTYDEFGQMKTRTVVGVGATTSRTYDDYGNAKTETDAENHTSEMTWDVAGNLLTRKDARGKTWSATYTPQGWRETTSDPLRNAITYRYDKVGNLRERTDAENRSSTFDYFADGQLQRVKDATGAVMTFDYDKDRLRVSSTDADGVITNYGYDTDGRPTTTTDADNNVTTIDYGSSGDLAGRIARVRYPTFCEEYKYDQRGRTTSILTLYTCGDAASRTERRTFGYDAGGNLVSRTDALGRTTLFEHDALGRVASQTDALAGVTRVEYDALDNPTRVTDAGNSTRRYGYDRNGLLTSEIRALGGAIEYRYDATGNAIGRTSAGGERRVLEYDDAGRALSEAYYAAGSNRAGQTVLYSYDRSNLLTGYIQSGDTASSAVYEHDGTGRRMRETLTYGAGAAAFTRIVDQAWYPSGKRKKLTYPDGTAVEFGYTSGGRLETAGAPGGGEMRWSDYDWRVAKTVSLPGAVRSYTFDSLQRIAGIKVQAPGGMRMDYAYTYDVAGNVTQKTTQQGTFTYAYDALDRLKEATPPAALLGQGPGKLPLERYGYDAVHHRLSSEASPGDWRYDADGQLLGYGLGQERKRYEYDGNGNTKGAFAGDAATPTESLVYDAAERLRELHHGGQVVAQYQYDPFGRRIRKETAEGVTWYQYNEQGLIAEYDATGAAKAIYGWLPDATWGTAPLWSAQRVAGVWDVNYYHNDLLDAPQLMTDASGDTVWSGLADAFGATQVSASSRVTNPLRLPGQYFDAESGTHYNLFRDYDPQLGRYRQNDPIGQRGGLNTYVYVRGNPQARVDPWGLTDLLYTSPLVGPNATPAQARNALNSHVGLSFIRSPAGALTVGIHSNGESFIGPDNTYWSVEKLAKRIKKDRPDYKKFAYIRLYACRSGVSVNGSPILAQQLADALGITIEAPGRYNWVSMFDPLDPDKGIWGKDANKRLNRAEPGGWIMFPPVINTHDDEGFTVTYGGG